MNVRGFHVETATFALAEETLPALNNNIRSKEMQKDHTPAYYWIPAKILVQKVPDLVQEFYAHTHIKKKVCQTESAICTL